MHTEPLALLPDSQIKNRSAQEIWMKREVDRLLDWYLEGADLGRIAARLSRNRKAVVRKLQEYIYNERDRVINYDPRCRQSRRGRRITPNEKQIIAECRKKGVEWKHIARVLMREVKEISLETDVQKAKARTLTCVAPSLDFVLACRYAFHIYKEALISDETYDDLKQEEIEYGGAAGAFAGDPHDCPTRIKTLTIYLSERKKDEGKKYLK